MAYAFYTQPRGGEMISIEERYQPFGHGRFRLHPPITRLRPHLDGAGRQGHR